MFVRLGYHTTRAFPPSPPLSLSLHPTRDLNMRQVAISDALK